MVYEYVTNNLMNWFLFIFMLLIFTKPKLDIFLIKQAFLRISSIYVGNNWRIWTLSRILDVFIVSRSKCAFVQHLGSVVPPSNPRKERTDTVESGKEARQREHATWRSYRQLRPQQRQEELQPGGFALAPGSAAAESGALLFWILSTLLYTAHFEAPMIPKWEILFGRKNTYIWKIWSC